MNEDKDKLNDDLLNDALDSLFDEEFDNYSNSKANKFMSEYTLLNIPKIDDADLQAPNIMNYENDKKTYDNDGARRKINDFFSREKVKLTPIRIAVICVVFLFVTTFGFSMFSQQLLINGRASVSGALNLVYSCNVIQEGALKSDGLGKCTVHNNEVSTKSLLYKPTNKVNYAVTITNNGNFPVKLYDVISSNNVTEDLLSKGDEAYLDSDGFLSAYYTINYNDNEYKGDKYSKNANIMIEAGQSIVVIINHNWLSLEKQPYVEDSATIKYDMELIFEQATS